MSTQKLTPLMAQYFAIREQHPDTLLLFQVGDFYELFFDDAKRASSFLAIALTKRGKCNGEDVPLCGMPVHAVQHYITKLVKGGFKVAICDQLSEPQPGRVVERGVTRIYTPGTLTDEQMLDEKSPSYLLSFYPHEDQWGLVFGELLTAQLFATTVPKESYRALESELARFFPDEVIMPKAEQSLSTHIRKLGYWVSMTSPGEDQVGLDVSRAWLEAQFSGAAREHLLQTPSLCSTMQLLHGYLQRTQAQSLTQFRNIQFYQADDYLVLDSATQRNLELVKNSNDGGRAHTLLSVLDHAKTAMGSRTIRKWLQRPLVQPRAIEQRLQAVAVLHASSSVLKSLAEALADMPDLERMVGRIALQKAQPHDYMSLKQALQIVPLVKTIMQPLQSVELFGIIIEKIRDFSALVALLETSLADSGSGMLIKRGFDRELDRLRDLVENAQHAMLQLEQQEIKRSGIGSLKIRFNKVFGYYIEVTKTNLERVPADFVRQQTLANCERYVTPQLLDLQRDIQRAEHSIGAVEMAAFERVKQAVLERLSDLRQLSFAISYLDGLHSFATVARDNNYVLPQFHENRDLLIEAGRHPVIEQTIDAGFVPNATALTDTESLWVVTGPNMGGKSTYLRQVALISVMAQCGSFVPARSARLPILDRIFTRIGAGDNLAQGKSTFLVEMEETAIICNQATQKSLVILDEVGRGTSTFDGLAIAQAVIEYLFTQVRALCLFATHYHELTKLHEQLPGIANYHLACRKTQRGIVFLHEVQRGVAPGSFGLEVAKLADLPPAVIERAREILQLLGENALRPVEQAASVDAQLLLEKVAYLEGAMRAKDAALQQIKNMNFDELSPRQAFDLLWELKRGL